MLVCSQVLWKVLCYGDEQRATCSPYYCNVFTEEVLQEAEQELRILNTHFHTHKELFELVNKREKLWDEKVAFENPACCGWCENPCHDIRKELNRYEVDFDVYLTSYDSNPLPLSVN